MCIDGASHLVLSRAGSLHRFPAEEDEAALSTCTKASLLGPLKEGLFETVLSQSAFRDLIGAWTWVQEDEIMAFGV